MTTSDTAQGLRIQRRFTTEGVSPYASIEWSHRDSRITNPDGSVVFEMLGAEIPVSWSQVATDIMVSKYFRKAGIPQVDENGNPILDEDGRPVLGPERSARQVFDRLAGTWRHWGEKSGYFGSAADADAFEDELRYMLATQMAAPNSPQWFNTGLHHAYGLTGPAQGFWYVDPKSDEMTVSPDSYSRPAPHACFPAGTRVSTADGFLPIEKIEPGSLVLTHTGALRPVRNTMQRQVDEPLVRLRIGKLTTDLVSTANHPVWAIRSADVRAHRAGKIDAHPSWIDASDIEVGDFVMVGGQTSSDVVPEDVDLADFAGSNFAVDESTITTRNSAHHPTLRRFVSFADPSLMRLIGRWLGDGSIGHETRDGELASVNFVFNAGDTVGIGDVADLMWRHFGATATAEFANGQKTAHLRYTRRPLARWFAQIFGEGFAGKSLPGWVYEMPAEHRIELLVGLFRSDGCVLDQGNSTSLCFDQSNQDLAEGIWRIARSLGYAPALIGGSVRPGGTAPHFRVQISSKDAVDLALRCGVRVPDSKFSSRELRVADGVAYRVNAVSREDFYGTVYNFEVEEDESYVANGAVVHNCFILGVKDDLVNPGGIMDLWVREARIFKFGSGAGSNFSAIRGEEERLSGGGKSSGVMSFLKIGDRAAGAIKSGGTTRRAAKMVILDIDHPDIETFIDWKKHEEDKARVLIQHGGMPADFNGEAYLTVSGQNSNNSVRVTNQFIQAVIDDGDWQLTNRTDGKVRKTVKARDLWHRIAAAAWACADPGLQFDTTINEWHTCPAGGRIKASNPCSEYMFLDDTACNLASLNLITFYDAETGAFDIEAYQHAIRLWTIVLEISVTMAHFPSAEIAQGSYDYRTLGLGYANLGSLLMQQGIAYDSDRGRAIAGALTAILTGYSYATSAEMASVVGTFPRYAENAENMLRVIRNHRRAAYDTSASEYEGITSHVMGIDQSVAPLKMLLAARESWDLALSLGEKHGYRNAQATVLAPTGCLVGGSMIPTERGLVRLRSLGDPHGAQWQDLGVKVSTDEGAKTATRFCINGVEPVVTVETGRGYRIQGTPTHRIKVVEPSTGAWEWKRFGDLAADDLVPLQLDQLVGGPQIVNLPPLGEMHWTGDFTTVVPRHMTPELAEFVGYFMGDGSLHAKGLRLAVAADDFDVVEHLRLLGKQLFNLAAHTTDRQGYTEVSFNSVGLALWWEAAGFAKHAPVEGHTGKGWHPHIPDAVLASNDRSVYQAFLRGLFEADGTVNGGYPSWSTTSVEFSHDVQSLLLAIGYPTTRKIDTTGWGESDLAVLRILNLSHSARFGEEIGFLGASKQAALSVGDLPQGARKDHIPMTREMVDRLAPENDSLRKTMLTSLARHRMVSRRSAEELHARTGDPRLGHLLGYFYDRVVSAALGEEELTYDLSVPENVTYVANGFVSHNTIGLLMDCDTTGVEPDFALVKFKKLAGGGYFKIVNQSVTPALRHLGYTPDAIKRIVEYIVGTSSFEGAPHVNRETLAEKGLTADEIERIEKSLPAMFELKHAFNVFSLGEATLQRLGFEADDYTAWDFDFLRAIGFTSVQIREAGDHICGRQTIEDAPGLDPDHLSVFDTANRNGKYGERFIHYTGHIKMMAAAQPFISGAISKTINMPNEVTPEDIEESYRLSWELGLKAMALYRDGSKASQPLSSASDDGQSEEETEEITAAHEVEKKIMWGQIPAGMSPTEAYAQGMRPPRFLLPSRRGGYNQEARIGGHKVYLRTGEYQDGTLGEIFIDLAKEGATLKGILSCFAIAVSKGLQYGVPLSEFVDTFTFQTFEPRGMVEGHPNIKMANSIIDYVFRALGVEYLHRDELAQVPPTREMELAEPPKGLAVEAGVQLDLNDAAAEVDVDAVAAAARFVDGPVRAPETPVVPSSPAPTRTVTATQPVRSGDAGTASMQSALGEMMGDAPLCDICGHITVRNGSCYKCLNCGNSLGCS